MSGRGLQGSSLTGLEHFRESPEKKVHNGSLFETFFLARIPTLSRNAVLRGDRVARRNSGKTGSAQSMRERRGCTVSSRSVNLNKQAM